MQTLLAPRHHFGSSVSHDSFPQPLSKMKRARSSVDLLWKGLKVEAEESGGRQATPKANKNRKTLVATSSTEKKDTSLEDVARGKANVSSTASLIRQRTMQTFLIPLTRQLALIT